MTREISPLEPNYKLSTERAPVALELLAPAASLEIGRLALSAGADAIYIGAPKYGARSAVGVSVADITHLCQEAHHYRAKVYVALNTILTDNELVEAVDLVRALYEAGVDALIIQDLGLLVQELPPIPFHASTQCHNHGLGPLRMLEDLGFEQVVMPREWSVVDIQSLVGKTTLQLEAFVHGALCVSYSGRCYISEICTGRSANRGACAQFCRMSYDLEDAQGNRLRTKQYLLSLRDLNRSEILEPMIEAGVRSFKIEGRLKGADYVRNVTAHYRGRLDEIIARRPDEFCRASLGRTSCSFTPHPSSSFSRLFTTYNTPIGHPISPHSINPYTSKSMGEEIGRVVQVSRRRIRIALQECAPELTNGDGLIFLSTRGEVAGAQINQVSPITPSKQVELLLSQDVALFVGDTVYRNHNHRLELILARPDATRREIPVQISCVASSAELVLEICLIEYPEWCCRVTEAVALEPALRNNDEHLRRTLGKLGDTPYSAHRILLDTKGLYLPPSLLAQLRRKAVEGLLALSEREMAEERSQRGSRLRAKRVRFLDRLSTLRPEQRIACAKAYDLPDELDFSYNVANKSARWLYASLGVHGEIAAAAEVVRPEGSVCVMTTRHCLMNQLGYCTRTHRIPPFALPLFLVRGKQRFRITTDCRSCQMHLWVDDR